MQGQTFPARLLALCTLVLCLSVLLTSAFAQLPTGTILGTVKDATGAVVPDTAITVRNLETSQTRTGKTDSDGAYRFPALPVGRYSVQAEHAGFRSEIRQNLTLAISQEAVLDFALQIGTAEQEVVVTGEAPLVDTTTSSLGGLVNEQRIAELPLNGRNYVDLSLMQLGVTRQTSVGTTAGMGGVWYSSNGAPPRSNNYLLDGASMLNLFGATASSIASTSLGVEGIREYKVVTNSFSAEYGITMGSQMTIVTKSGSNRWHGSAFEYLRNSAMDAANYFDPTPKISPGDRIAPLRRNQFGGSLGGPIRKDQTFFFTTYEGLRETQGVPNILSVVPANCFNPISHQVLATGNPCAAASGGNVAPVMQPIANLFGKFAYPNLPNNQFGWVFDQPTSENYAQMRVDHNFSANDSMFARYTIDDTQTTHATGLYSPYRNPWASRSQFVTLSENHIFSTTLLNTARFSFSRTRMASDSLSGISNASFPGTSLVCYPGNCLEVGSVAITGVISTLGPDISSPSEMKQNIFAWSDDLFYTAGRHSLKFGALINHYQQDIQQQFQYKGGLTFLSVPNFMAGLANQYNLEDPLRNNENKFDVYNSLGFYAQDDFRATSRLTLNLGLRYEFITVPSEVHGVQSAFLHLLTTDTPNSAVLGPTFQNPSLHNFSPRVGFAWDIFGNGKTSLRGGFAQVFDLGNYGSAMIQDAIGTPPFSQQATVAAVSPTKQLSVVLPLQIPATGYNPSVRTINYYLQQPKMLQYNLSVERQLPGHVALTVAYAGSRGYNLFQVQDANPNVRAGTNPDTWVACPTGTNCRINPKFSSITFLNTAGDSWYNSLQVGVIKQLSKGLQFQSSYTYGKVLDDTQGQLPNDTGGVNSPTASNPYNPMLDRGPSSFDVTQNWRFNLIYHVPDLTQQAFLGKVVNGWGLSTIVSVQTGYPFSPVLNRNNSFSGVNNNAGGIDRPNYGPNYDAGSVIMGSPTRWFNPAMFTTPAAGTLGSVGRDTLRGPGLSNVDFSLTKGTKLRYLGESGSLEFRAEFFNLLNHPNFGMPALTLGTTTVGQPVTGGIAGLITSTVNGNDSRRVQLALKILF